MVDEPCTEEHVKLAGILLKAVEATLDVTPLDVPSLKPRGWRM
jgi:hypothetical protein